MWLSSEGVWSPREPCCYWDSLGAAIAEEFDMDHANLECVTLARFVLQIPAIARGREDPGRPSRRSSTSSRAAGHVTRPGALDAAARDTKSVVGAGDQTSLFQPPLLEQALEQAAWRSSSGRRRGQRPWSHRARCVRPDPSRWATRP